jgi:hypothetical protein
MQTRNLKLSVLLAAASLLFFTACKKEINSDSSAASQTVSHAQPSSEKAVHILATFTPDNFPNVSGTFTAWGALGDNVKGDATMDIGGLTPLGLVAHCIVVLTFFDSEHNASGTITIKQECEFASPGHVFPDAKGQWQIVGGTGIYDGIKGNGITTMPPPFDEDMVGVIQ